jgi:hypothetical protein
VRAQDPTRGARGFVRQFRGPGSSARQRRRQRSGKRAGVTAASTARRLLGDHISPDPALELSSASVPMMARGSNPSGMHGKLESVLAQITTNSLISTSSYKKYLMIENAWCPREQAACYRMRRGRTREGQQFPAQWRRKALAAVSPSPWPRVGRELWSLWCDRYRTNAAGLSLASTGIAADLSPAHCGRLRITLGKRGFEQARLDAGPAALGEGGALAVARSRVSRRRLSSAAARVPEWSPWME